MAPVFLAVLIGFPAAEPVRLTVPSAAAPKPALKYQLLPEVRELNTGNAVQWYARCFAEQRNFFFHKSAVEDRNRHRAEPLSLLATRKLVGYGGSALTQADFAARLETADWQVLERLKDDDPSLAMPELEPLRALGQSLQLRLRIEVAERRYDDAIRSAKTLFAFARHLGEYPATSVNRLGFEIACLGLDTLEELIQQPGSPNLYWALSDLPTPLVNLRKGAQGDRAAADAELRLIQSETILTDEQIDDLIGRLSGRLGYSREQAGQSPRGIRNEFKVRVEDKSRVATVRDRLIAEAQAKTVWFKPTPVLRIMAMPPAQLILLDEKRVYEERRDEEMKRIALAPWQAEKLRAEPGDGGLFAELLPHLAEARREQVRVEQRIAVLRAIEALRMYAASHGGKLPASLDAVGVPLAADPFTGKPFDYKLGGFSARLIATDRQYEITVAGTLRVP